MKNPSVRKSQVWSSHIHSTSAEGCDLRQRVTGLSFVS